jgi:hypothetical protein
MSKFGPTKGENISMLSTALMICALVAMGCSQSYQSASATDDFTVRTLAELRDGTARVANLKEELIGRGFYVTSTALSNDWEEETLRGDYGNLKGVDVTLRVATQLDVKQPHFRSVVIGSFPDRSARKAYDELCAHIHSTFQGKD